MNLPFGDESFDIVICSHVYEHVPDPERMFDQIHRVLKPGGVCYFSAGNRLMWNEPHYDLPLLSVLPRPLAHLYIRLAGKADRYHEKHLTYWGTQATRGTFSDNRLHEKTRAGRRSVPHAVHASCRQPEGQCCEHFSALGVLAFSGLHLDLAQVIFPRRSGWL